MSDNFSITLRINAVDGFSVETMYDDDGTSGWLIVSDVDSRRNVIVDADNAAELVNDLLAGRTHVAESHFGYGTMWTLEVVR